jgi:hypothetical protein
MKGRTLADTAINIAGLALLLAFVPTLIWVATRAPDLKAAHILVFVLAGWGVSVAHAVRADGRLDEVELAGARFGARWGLPGGFAVVSLLSILPVAQPLLVNFGAALARVEADNMTGESRLFLFGALATFAAQEALRSIFTKVWNWSKR